MENIALQSLQIFSILCYGRKLQPFLGPKVVAISVRNTIMRKFANLVMLYFPHNKTFSTKFWEFTTFGRFFREFSFFWSGFLYTPKNYHLFKVDKNRMQQCCAVHIVHSCRQYCSALLSLNQPAIRCNNDEKYC